MAGMHFQISDKKKDLLEGYFTRKFDHPDIDSKKSRRSAVAACKHLFAEEVAEKLERGDDMPPLLDGWLDFILDNIEDYHEWYRNRLMRQQHLITHKRA